MLDFWISIEEDLKTLVKLIKNISNEAFIEFSDDEVRFSLYAQHAEADVLLIIKATAFFRYYRCTEYRVFRGDPLQLQEILDAQEFWDRMHVNLVEESDSLPFLNFQIYDLTTSVKPIAEKRLEVREAVGDDMVREVNGYDCGVNIAPKDFEKAVSGTRNNQKPLTISINRTIVTLSSDGKFVRVIEAQGPKNAPEVTYELTLPLYRYTPNISFACLRMLTDSSFVKLRFTSVGPPLPPSLEFPVSTACKLLFYFPQHASKNRVFLRVLTAESLKPLLKSISGISKFAVIKFTQDEVAIWAEDVKNNSRALLKIADCYFTEFYCRDTLVVMADLVRIASIVRSMNEDDGVCIFVRDVHPIRLLGFHISNSRTGKNETEEVNIHETLDRKLEYDDSLCMYEVNMDSQLFRDILAHSVKIRKPITVTVTTMSVTLFAGSNCITLPKRYESAMLLRNALMFSMHLYLYNHAEALFTACENVGNVRLRLSDVDYSVNWAPPFLEFSRTRFSNFLFYFAWAVTWY